MLRYNFLRLLVLALLPVVVSAVGPALAEAPAEKQIIDAAEKYRADFCVRTPLPQFKNEEEARRWIEGLRKNTRDLLVESRRSPDETKARPQIDFDHVLFEFNSATPGKSDPDWVAVLAAVLHKAEMKDQIVVLIGHTDARGSKAYNRGLSERRAEAVKRLLIDKFSIPADRLTTLGFGKSCLKNPSRPYAPENRRLHVVSVPTS